LKAPALIRRVEPIYPDLAVFSHIAGVVLLDAVVDATGHVQTITVLKGQPLLATAAIDAVKQWEWSSDSPRSLRKIPRSRTQDLLLRGHRRVTFGVFAPCLPDELSQL
jgi:outer membrane biosynthesis protein TonB